MTPTVVLIAVSLATGLFGPSSLQQSTPSTPKPTQSESTKPADTDVSVTGCLFKGEAPTTFVLYNGKKDPKDPYEMGVHYLLFPLAGLQFTGHVAHEVRVTGVIDDKPETVLTKRDDRLPRLNAKGLKMESGTCAAELDEDGAEDAEFSDDSSDGWLSGGGQAGFGDPGGFGMPLYGMASHGQSSSTQLGSGLFGRIGGLARTSSVSGAAGTASTTSLFGSSTSGSSGSSFGSKSAPTGSYGLLTSLGTSGTGTAGPTIAWNAAASQLGYVDLSGSSTSNSSSAAPIANPEPATLILLGTGLIYVARASRRRFGL